MNTKIKEVLARAISDSRGNPTIEAAVIAGRYIGKAAVPSGASKGMYEAVELRDRNGKGVSLAVDNVNIIINKALVGKEVHDQAHIDNLMIELDGTKNKSKLGANAILSTSLAVARVRAKVLGKPLYASAVAVHEYNQWRKARKKLVAVPGVYDSAALQHFRRILERKH
jgi:enolase